MPLNCFLQIKALSFETVFLVVDKVEAAEVERSGECG
jgi:hypothetical protein